MTQEQFTALGVGLGIGLIGIAAILGIAAIIKWSRKYVRLKRQLEVFYAGKVHVFPLASYEPDPVHRTRMAAFYGCPHCPNRKIIKKDARKHLEEHPEIQVRVARLSD